MSNRLHHFPGEYPVFSPDHVVLATPAIWHPSAPREGGVVLFRRAFVLPHRQRRVRLWFSASMRAELFLDGRRLARGPGRWDPDRWGVVPVMVGPLTAGRHVLAARVVHFGTDAGRGQLGAPAFFLLAAEDAALHVLVGTGAGWRCHHDRARTFDRRHCWGDRRPYFVVGSGERIDAARQPRGWRGPAGAVGWDAATVVCGAAGNPWGNRPLDHELRPDPLPPMAESPQRFWRVAEAPPDLLAAAGRWVRDAGTVTIPPRRRVRLVLDQGGLTNAWPELVVDGGAGAEIGALAAEAPFTAGGGRKLHRDRAAGAAFYGFRDCFLPDGGADRRFDTLWFRSFRYWVLDIRTRGAALRLRSVGSRATAFPIRRRAGSVAAGSAAAGLRGLWDTAWRTARLCAHDTFMDCPYYEQAQFIGDSLVQARYHYLVAGDDRLARRCLEDFAAARLPSGLPPSHYPARAVQVLPTFALFWIGLLRDFLRYRGDRDLAARHRETGRGILAWFERHRRSDGLIGRLDAPFTDWTPAFPQGNAPQDADGGSAIVTALWACACRWQAEVEEALGDGAAADHRRRQAADLGRRLLAGCWDPAQRLLADTPARRSWSLHAQVFAVLAGCWPAPRAAAILRRAMADPACAPPGTFYFCFHLVEALVACGSAAAAVGLLPLWDRALADTGLTTFPESVGEPRSDCHAWSVTPALLLLEGILGVRPAPGAVGQDRIAFAPCLSEGLDRIRGTVPTPQGPVEVTLIRDGARLRAGIVSPVPVTVPGRHRALSPGRHRLDLAIDPPPPPAVAALIARIIRLRS